MLLQAYHEVLERTPWRRHLLFHQFCLSGGHMRFMRSRNHVDYYGTRSWPIFAISSSGSFEPSLSDFVNYWIEEFSKAIREGGLKTLKDIYFLAEEKYWEANAEIKKLN